MDRFFGAFVFLGCNLAMLTSVAKAEVSDSNGHLVESLQPSLSLDCGYYTNRAIRQLWL